MSQNGSLRALTLALALGCAATGGCSGSGGEAAFERDSLSVAAVLGSDLEGYATADRVREFRFPADHGAHEDFRTEWWYLTGNLDGPQGERFGFQFTIFRTALTPPDASEAATSSDWSTRQVYMGHFALTDAASETFHSTERFARGSAGLAGARAEPFRVWLEDWSIASVGESFFPLRMQARDGETRLELVFEAEKPYVLQGDRGLSQKSAEPGNASYYYAYTRLSAKGRVQTPRGETALEGLAWLDREWSTSALAEDQVGWDWFSLQLDDGTELMLYQMRLAEGGVSPESDGAFIAASGERTRLSLEDFDIEVKDTWTSPRSDGTYPSRWRIRVPGQGLDLELRPVLADQELETSFRYWEGAVDVTGTDGMALGRGYVEMTGYEPR